MLNLSLYQNESITVKLKGKDVKIHALCTGTVAVKNSFRTKHGYGVFSKLNILFDRTFTDFLPIWVWVIEHPEGLIVIDTGETTSVNTINNHLANENSFSKSVFKNAVKFNIGKKDELDFQFRLLDLKLEDVDLIILTHLHLDHTDGLKFFPKKEIIVGDFEFKNPSGNMPSTYPKWFKPNKVGYMSNQIDIFDKAYPITSTGDLLYIPTPGHTLGHSSVLFKTDEFDIIFAGDCSYNQIQVLMNEIAGANVDYRQTIKTYNNLVAYASKQKTIYLPSHDEFAAIRLKNKDFLVDI